MHALMKTYFCSVDEIFGIFGEHVFNLLRESGGVGSRYVLRSAVTSCQQLHGPTLGVRV